MLDGHGIGVELCDLEGVAEMFANGRKLVGYFEEVEKESEGDGRRRRRVG